VRIGFQRAGVIGLLSLCLIGDALAQRLIWLGTLGGFTSEAYDVSNNGVVVGVARNAQHRQRAFRWTETEGMQDLGTLGGPESTAYSISDDGTVIVGTANINDSSIQHAFKWTAATGMVSIHPSSVSGNSVAYKVSGDGNIIVGSVGYTYNEKAYRWNADHSGAYIIAGAPSWSRSVAYGVSYDGSYVVGWASHLGARAFRWYERDGTIQNLGSLNDSDYSRSSAYGVSHDGQVVVGSADICVGEDPYHGCYDSEYYPFLWTPTQGMQALYDYGSSSSATAYDVSADGSIAVGFVDDSQTVAFRWRAGTGFENLNTVYASLLTDGSELLIAYGISPDGRYIVGEGYNASSERFEAFLLDTGAGCNPHTGDVDQNGCVDDADLLAVLFAFGNTGNQLGRVDVNCDAVVDDADLLLVLFNFGNGC